jgi:hypothetical protein
MAPHWRFHIWMIRPTVQPIMIEKTMVSYGLPCWTWFWVPKKNGKTHAKRLLGSPRLPIFMANLAYSVLIGKKFEHISYSSPRFTEISGINPANFQLKSPCFLLKPGFSRVFPPKNDPKSPVLLQSPPFSPPFRTSAGLAECHVQLRELLRWTHGPDPEQLMASKWASTAGEMWIPGGPPGPWGPGALGLQKIAGEQSLTHHWMGNHGNITIWVGINKLVISPIQ